MTPWTVAYQTVLSMLKIVQIKIKSFCASKDIIKIVENSTECKNIFQSMCLPRVYESEVAQSCPALCDPVDCSPQGSSVHGFSRQEYWSGLPFPSPGNHFNPEIEPASPTLQADALPP